MCAARRSFAPGGAIDLLKKNGYAPIIYNPAVLASPYSIPAPPDSGRASISISAASSLSAGLSPGCPSTGASWAAHTQNYVETTTSTTSPLTVALPPKTGAVDFWIDFVSFSTEDNLLEFTIGLLDEDGSGSTVSFQATAAAITCSGYVAIWHRRSGQITQVSIRPSGARQFLLPAVIRVADKATKK